MTQADFFLKMYTNAVQTFGKTVILSHGLDDT